ncbi:protein of unknown function [Taphrina deformans PYCC 5710]|uniref:Uncharacterized protein n=1 Tax=Taphrina deformans (strain PYCC 5710 / ATCC 11124 / CBS 356.35 / IMI 108563 / JCM 9778 / NBRC 8474) TaxID=1097556 RepID=R4X8I1_TAPDE|nr:protein of unknown function [Taphrina deformans PYCC 5710]|eukprot:CCG81630.1 protein of unknown function [Taphrina deformans PYCC 5710]
MATERENGGWKRFIDKKLFEHYDFYNIFSSSQALQWSYDDWPEALARGQLVRPKPDFAFGLKLVLRSEENRLAQRLPLVSDPTISASCVPSDPMRLSFPFLVLESRSTQGDQLSTNHQMANDLIKSLDVIAAIGQEENLFSIGICQIGFSYEIYIGCSSTQNIPPDVPREVNKECASLKVMLKLLVYTIQAFFRRSEIVA